MHLVFRLNGEMWNSVKHGSDISSPRKRALHSRCCYVFHKFFLLEFSLCTHTDFGFLYILGKFKIFKRECCSMDKTNFYLESISLVMSKYRINKIENRKLHKYL